MSCDALRLKLLAARDARQQALGHALQAGWPATLALALNIAGADKTPPGAAPLFAAIMRQLVDSFPQCVCLHHDEDALGPYALVGVALSAEQAKRRCLAIEESEPAARLVDVDVYDRDGVQLGRAQLGLPARRCLVCGEAAVDCMREKRHPLEAIVARTDELLVTYRA